jgi:hypothetical protein
MFLGAVSVVVRGSDALSKVALVRKVALRLQRGCPFLYPTSLVIETLTKRLLCKACAPKYLSGLITKNSAHGDRAIGAERARDVAEFYGAKTMTTKKVLMIVVVAVAIAAGAVVALAQSAKMTICHNAGSIRYTTSIASSDWPGHEGHGDSTGACPASPSR